MSNSTNSFKFNENLNKDSLDNLYQSDLEFALEMFEVFVEVVDIEFTKLESSVTEKDYAQIKQDAHKMKPMFTMVGLPHMTSICQEMESKALNSDSILVDSLFSKLKSEQEKHFSIIQTEIERIKEHLNKM